MEVRNFNIPDELVNVVLVVEEKRLFVHREVLSVWSPVFMAMFSGQFAEREKMEIPLPGKRYDDIIDMLKCIYPPISPVTESNVDTLLPLVEEYQMLAVKNHCEMFLLSQPPSLHLLYTAQNYGLRQLLARCLDYAKHVNYATLTSDPYFELLDPDNRIQVLLMRVQDLEEHLSQTKKIVHDRETRIFGCLSDLASGFGNFCTECKTRKINEECFNCLYLFRDRVKAKTEELKNYRQNNPIFLKDDK